MSRLVLVDTSDQLPGLLPLHGWSALMASELVLVGTADHPFIPHLEAAELRYEVVRAQGESALTRQDLLSGLSPADRRRAEWVVDRVRAEGEVAYVFGPGDTESYTRTLGMEAARAEVEVEIVYFGVTPKGTTLLELVEVETRLRGPEGCPWDREQDHASLVRYAIEEVYELAEAVAARDADAIREELGDVLLQVVFQAQIAEDAGDFDIDDVARGIVDKLVRRHPHVFGSAQVDSPAGVMANWEHLKADEKPERGGLFDGVVTAQPALPLITTLQRKAARAGFDWTGVDEALEAVQQGLRQVAAAEGDREHELGDLLAAVVGLARHLEIDPETALRASAQRFRSRLDHAAGRADRPLTELSRREWIELWDNAKG